MSRETINRLARHHGAFLATSDDVGSSIRYHFEAKQHQYKDTKSRHFDGSVSITDCTRSISWGGYGYDGFEELRRKLNKAIAVFNKALEDLEEVEAAYDEWTSDEDD